MELKLIVCLRRKKSLSIREQLQREVAGLTRRHGLSRLSATNRPSYPFLLTKRLGVNY